MLMSPCRKLKFYFLGQQQAVSSSDQSYCRYVHVAAGHYMMTILALTLTEVLWTRKLKFYFLGQQQAVSSSDQSYCRFPNSRVSDRTKTATSLEPSV